MSKVIGENLNAIRARVRNAQPADIASAVHEAGHAVVIMTLGYRVDRISTLPWGAYEAHVSWTLGEPADSDEAVRAWANDLAATAVAGDVAYDFLDPAILAVGVQYNRGRTLGGDHDDIRSAFRVTGDPMEQRAAFAKQARTTAKEILQANRTTFDRLAFALLHHKRLSEADIRAIVGAELADRWKLRKAA